MNDFRDSTEGCRLDKPVVPFVRSHADDFNLSLVLCRSLEDIFRIVLFLFAPGSPLLRFITLVARTLDPLDLKARRRLFGFARSR